MDRIGQRAIALRAGPFVGGVVGNERQHVRIRLVVIHLSVIGEREQRFNFCVQGEAVGKIEINDAAGVIQLPVGVARLLAHHDAVNGLRRPAQLGQQIGSVAQQKRVGIHQQRSIPLGLDGKRRQH